jgi:hypothetical protein
MDEHPILYSGDMVRALLDGRKTQTRRPVTVPWAGGHRCQPYEPYYVETDGRLFFCDEYGDYHPIEECIQPFGVAGDTCWVRETWAQYPGRCEAVIRPRMVSKWNPACDIVWRADGELPIRWRPSIHMPRWASRLTQTVRSVRAERLQVITDADVQAEGAPFEYISGPGAPDFAEQRRLIFRDRWDAIYGRHDPSKPDYSWAANPWVWRGEFERAVLRDAA